MKRIGECFAKAAMSRTNALTPRSIGLGIGRLTLALNQSFDILSSGLPQVKSLEWIIYVIDRLI